MNCNDFIHPQESAQPVLPSSSSLSGIKTTPFTLQSLPPLTIPQPGGWSPGWPCRTPENIFVTSASSLNLSLWETLLGMEVWEIPNYPQRGWMWDYNSSNSPHLHLWNAGTQGTSLGPAAHRKTTEKLKKCLCLSVTHTGEPFSASCHCFFLVCGWF